MIANTATGSLLVQRGLVIEGTMLGNGRVARLSYDLVTVLLVFKLASRFNWEVIGADSRQDQVMTRESIEQEFDVELKEPGLWARWSLIGTFVLAMVVFVIVMAIR